MPKCLPLSVVCLVLASSVVAQPVPDYGIEWRTIGAPGNEDASPADFPGLEPPAGFGPMGRVDYEFRMSHTELTVSQYFEFVQTYTRWNPAAAFDSGLYGSHIVRLNNDPSNLQWWMFPDAVNAPADMAWLYAARYVNWLHNDKADALWAFETGAYDMSTFVRGPDGFWTGQTQHSPGARFWIPSLDEWTKAMHYDPNKHGPGRPGYWVYPHSSDESPVGGLPGTQGAETGAGEYPGGEGYRLYPVGSYPDAQSPWGLLDGSGGVSELLVYHGSPFFALPARGSRTTLLDHFFADRIDSTFGVGINFAVSGLRIAGVVPAPASVVLSAMAASVCICRRRGSW